MVRRLLRTPVTWVALALLAVAGVFGLYWFQPWKLFTSNQVSDPVPVVAPAPGTTTPAAPPGPAGAGGPAASTAPAGNRLLAQGSFITHEHATSGEAQLVQLADGRRQLVLRNLSTSDGPDLRVWLSDQAVVEGTAGWRVFDDGAWVELARLRGNKGNQVYDIPAGVDLSRYRSVSIWCKRFAVSFGAAPLSPA
ncbi:MAG TPA: DM13 domain-containing protein [Micromonosporaceae bacterium]|nr:DM13 domain-containing protein [Micromonosporaceae bacterium]